MPTATQFTMRQSQILLWKNIIMLPTEKAYLLSPAAGNSTNVAYLVISNEDIRGTHGRVDKNIVVLPRADVIARLRALGETITDNALMWVKGADPAFTLLILAENDIQGRM